MLGNLFTFGSSFLGVLSQGPEESHMDIFSCAIKCVFVFVFVYTCYGVLGDLVSCEDCISLANCIVWFEKVANHNFASFVVQSCVCVCALWSLRFSRVS